MSDPVYRILPDASAAEQVNRILRITQTMFFANPTTQMSAGPWTIRQLPESAYHKPFVRTAASPTSNEFRRKLHAATHRNWKFRRRGLSESTGNAGSSTIVKNGKQSGQRNVPRPGLLDRSDRWADTALFGSYSPRNGPGSHAEQAP